jgi:hypothetical protein
MRLRRLVLFPVALSLSLSLQPRANALGFGDIESIIGLGSDIFQTISSGSFSTSSIGNIFSSVGGLSGNSTLQELGNLSSSLGGYDFGGGTFGGGDLGGIDTGETGGLSSETLSKINSSVSATPSIYKSIQSRNWGAAAGGIIGLLGDLGVINPQAASSSESLSSGGVDSEGNIIPGQRTSSIIDEIRQASTPSQIYAISRKSKAAYNLASNDISQLVLSKEGQKLIVNRQKEAALGLEVSNTSAASSSALLEDANGLYESQQKAVEASEKTVQGIGKAKESLVALKGLGTLGGIHSAQFAMLQAQGIIDTANSAYTAQQLKAIAAIEKLNGDHLVGLTVQSAAQTASLGGINNELDQINEYKQSQDRGQLAASAQSAQTVILPFPLDVQ